ncbi:hypothetical protein CJ739_1160 [Mariniflexile rhizosphaerae]|uniref:DUF4271 domain-containing protein n=1 Tax=unclassified Mariniflexile TaxID=2643887 RepID=UPI000CB13D3F|nr:DUF4271 domain-containing protein [Mariniflexile sp. TRM1-10]AXP80251.1 hypothetical protein CJ739_1160 [Mariniflexile sp. TRM1-10]PLB19357.1 MAG: putative membrane protein [Flavobacteriaceae bacterium FS1-H7996/R]
MLRDIISNDFFTIMLVVGMILIATAKLTSPKRFNDFISVLGNSKYLKIYSRDQKFFDKFDALLFANLIISVSLFCFISYKFFTKTNTISPDTMFKISFGISVFILIKVFIERLIGSLFEMDAIIDQYLFQKISYKNYLGLVLIPINALLLFSFKPTLTFFYVTVILLFIVILIGLVTSFKAHQSLIKHNFFYFILYLCALEIAPCIILYKVIISK